MTPSLSTALAAIRRDCERAIQFGEDVSSNISKDAGSVPLSLHRDRLFVSHSRTFCPVFARAVIGLMDALETLATISRAQPNNTAALALQSLADSWPKEGR